MLPDAKLHGAIAKERKVLFSAREMLRLDGGTGAARLEQRGLAVRCLITPRCFVCACSMTLRARLQRVVGPGRAHLGVVALVNLHPAVDLFVKRSGLTAQRFSMAFDL